MDIWRHGVEALLPNAFRHESIALLGLCLAVAHTEVMLCRTLHLLGRCCSTWGVRRGGFASTDMQDQHEAA